MHLFLWMNFGIGRSATSRNASEDSLRWVDIQMLASPRSRGWAQQLLMRVEMLVLSDDSITPRSVAPSGSLLCH